MKASDKEALVHQCLVDHYEKYYRIAYSYTFNEQDAMDVVQESAYKAILKSDRLKQTAYADTWICRIVMNEAVRFLGKNRGRTVDMSELPEVGEETSGEDLDLKEALEKLDEKDRAIVVLRYFEEEKLETIGRIMELNTNTVKSRLYRAMEKLKKYMTNGGAEYGKMEKGV